jgi:hypothetical protein
VWPEGAKRKRPDGFKSPWTWKRWVFPKSSNRDFCRLRVKGRFDKNGTSGHFSMALGRSIDHAKSGGAARRAAVLWAAYIDARGKSTFKTFSDSPGANLYLKAGITPVIPDLIPCGGIDGAKEFFCRAATRQSIVKTTQASHRSRKSATAFVKA